MIIKVKVRPNSGEQKIEKISDSEFIVRLKMIAEDNKANIELMKLMKKYFGKHIKIIKGLKSSMKIIEVID